MGDKEKYITIGILLGILIVAVVLLITYFAVRATPTFMSDPKMYYADKYIKEVHNG